MQTIRPSEPGGAEVLRLVSVPTPAPAPGQVLVRTEAIGVNFIDVYHRTGFYKTERPIPMGVEAAGVIEAVGAGVEALQNGQRVVWQGVPGSYSTHVLVPAERAVLVPSGIDAQTAAALFLQGLTAHYLCRDTFALTNQHVALVHAAAGGVGLLLVQLAKLAGARVLGTVSTPEKAALAREAGAGELIMYREGDFAAEVRRLTAGEGVNVVYDSVGQATFEGSLKSLAPRGYLVSFGQSSGAIGPIDPLVLASHGSLFLTRPTLAHYTRTRAELERRARELFHDVMTGALRVRIGATFSLAEAAAAHRALESRQTTGKVLLIPESAA